MAPAAMGAYTRPPDMGAGSRPPGPPGPQGGSSSTPSTSWGRTVTLSWAGASSTQGESTRRRSYAQIIKDSNKSNSPFLLQIHLLKIYDTDIPDSKPMNLSELHMSQLITDTLKIPLANCIKLDSQTGRYNKRELLVKPDTDLTNALTSDTPKSFRQHEIRVTKISNAATKVIFKGVPIPVPDEELLHLCEHYGDLVDKKVTRQTIRLGNDTKHDIMSSTRSVQVRLHPGKYLKNFYWLAGPNQGERGRRVTVLHDNQPPQCSHCFKCSPPPNHTLGPSQYCRGGGNGKLCKSLETVRTSMNAYIRSLREEGYTSL